jgi:Cu/Ag efflux protein CusF
MPAANTIPFNTPLGREQRADTTCPDACKESFKMIARLYRPLMMSLVPLGLIACATSPPTLAEKNDTTVPLGIDLGGSRPVIATAQPEAPAQAASISEVPQHSAEMQIAHAGQNDAHGTGTVNSVDPAQHKINLSHQPIPEIGWPAMTMEFPVAPSIDLKPIKPGTRVNFTIEQGQGGMYEIRAIAPAGGGR